MTRFRAFSRLRLRLRNRYARTAAGLLARRVVMIQSSCPVISFTFDDFPTSALELGGAILNKCGTAGTYYTSLGLLGRTTPVGKIASASDLERVLSAGHELGCHTFAHCHAWETRPQVFEASVVENRRALNALLPDATFETMSYPISNPRPGTKRRVSRYFACCRGGGQTFNSGLTDLNNVSAFFLEQSRENPGSIKELIDRNCAARGWLVFATHDVCDSPGPFGCTPEFFEDIVRYCVTSGAKLLPIRKALEVLCPSQQ